MSRFRIYIRQILTKMMIQDYGTLASSDPSSSSNSSVHHRRGVDRQSIELNPSNASTSDRDRLLAEEDFESMPGSKVEVTGDGVKIPFIGKGARLHLSDRASRYRWMVIFLCSFSGDGWTYESSVLSAIISLPGMYRSVEGISPLTSGRASNLGV